MKNGWISHHAAWRGPGWGWRLARLATGLVLAVPLLAAAKGNLNVANWSNYFIGPEAVTAFARAEDLNINYATIDSDDTLQAKLLSGHSGYDVVYPSSAYIAKQIEAGAFQPLDWSRLPNRGNLDPVLMKKVATQDPGNRHGVPYLWGTVGMAINVTRVRQILGAEARLDSWDLLFNPALVSRLHGCGVSLVDQASDVLPHVLAWMGRNPNSRDPADYEAAFAVLRRIRPYIDQFNSVNYIQDVAGGDICIAFAWSGDAGVMRREARRLHQPFEIRYVAPRGQSAVWATLMAIPKDAPNPDNAYKWINHMIDVQVAAQITNTVTYPNAVPASRALVDPQLVADAALMPTPEDVRDNFFLGSIDPALMHLITRLWLEFKAGR